MTQKYSSANTSVNKTSPAAIWRKINFAFLKTHAINTVIDYGCGQYGSITYRFCKTKGINFYYPYDPYWLSSEQNKQTMEHLQNKDTVCICANVLNVIWEDEVIKNIVSNITKASIWAVQIYEGNKSGVGKQTKLNCYQRNQRTKDYLHFFNKCGNIYIKGNIITNNLNILK